MSGPYDSSTIRNEAGQRRRQRQHFCVNCRLVAVERDLQLCVNCHKSKAQLPAKRTDEPKESAVRYAVRRARAQQCSTNESVREILAIFGYEVEA